MILYEAGRVLVSPPPPMRWWSWWAVASARAAESMLGVGLSRAGAPTRPGKSEGGVEARIANAWDMAMSTSNRILGGRVREAGGDGRRGGGDGLGSVF